MGLDLQIFHIERSSTRTNPKRRVKCSLCERKYELLPIEDYSWMQERFYLSESALASFKSIYAVGEIDLNDLFASVTGVAKLAHHRFHICIEKFNIRSYVDCYYDRRRDQLIGESVERL
jgi:hypothetical protein